MIDHRAPGIGAQPATPPPAATFTPPARSGYPIGGIVWYIGGGPLTNLEAGWLELDGQEHAIASYPELAARVGTLHNAAFGAPLPGNFRLPNMRGRMVITPDAVTFLTGQVGGAKDHILSAAEMPSHTHPPAPGMTHFWQANNAGAAPVVQAGLTYTGNNGILATGAAGGGAAHNNMPPYLVVAAYVRALR